MILGYSLTDWEDYGIKTTICADITKCPHCLITGKSGSGKSQSFLWIGYHLLEKQESILYLADFKAGKEYSPLRESTAYSYADEAIDMIQKYYDFYTHMRKNPVPNIPHTTLVIEEWFGLLSYLEGQDKKLKNELMSKIGEILALGRGIGNGIGIFLLLQRADASYFQSGNSREQFQIIVTYGRVSKEVKSMLFSGENLDNTRNYKAGQGIVLVDGQGGASEIIVPWVPEQNNLLNRIRVYMDSQPTIEQLIHQVNQAVSDAEQSL